MKAEEDDTPMASAPSFSLPMLDTSRALSISMPRSTTLPLTRSATLEAAVEAASHPSTPTAGLSAFQAPHNAFARADTLEAALQAAFNLPASGPSTDAAMPLSRSITLEAALKDATQPSALGGPRPAGPLNPGGLSEHNALVQVQQDIDSGLLDLGLVADPMITEQLASKVTAAAAAARSSGGDPVAAQLGMLDQATPMPLLQQETSGSAATDDAGALQWATSPQLRGSFSGSYGGGCDAGSFSSRSSSGSGASMFGVSMGSRGRGGSGLACADSGPLLVDNVVMPGLDALDALLVS